MTKQPLVQPHAYRMIGNPDVKTFKADDSASKPFVLLDSPIVQSLLDPDEVGEMLVADADGDMWDLSASKPFILLDSPIVQSLLDPDEVGEVIDLMEKALALLNAARKPSLTASLQQNARKEIRYLPSAIHRLAEELEEAIDGLA